MVAPQTSRAPNQREVLSEAVAKECRDRLKTFREDVPALIAAGLVTADGFEAASVSSQSMPFSKIAALTSTVVAVAHAFALETGLSECRNIIVETETGCALFMDVKAPTQKFALFAVATDAALLGRVLARARQCSHELVHVLSGN